MNPLELILFCATVGFIPTALLVGPVRRLALRIGAIDQPDNVRKLHPRPTARLGGLALLAGVVTGLLVLALYGGWYRQALLGEEDGNVRFLWGLGVSSLMIIGLGVVDDVRGLGARTKLIGQIVAAALLVYLVDDFRIRKLMGLDLGWLSVPLTIGWLVACANAVNLIDGLDGLAAGVTFIALATVVVFAVFLETWLVVLLAGTLCGAILGFLIFNWPPAIIFLGDSGSLFLGFVIGAISVRGSLKSHLAFAFAAAILPLGLPMMDTIVAGARRWAVGLPASRGDMEHVHHRLRDWGFSHRQVLVLLYAICAIFGALALMVNFMRGDTWPALLLVVLGVVILLGARLLWGQELLLVTQRVGQLMHLRTLMRRRRGGLSKLTPQLRGAASMDELKNAFIECDPILGIVEIELVPDKGPGFEIENGTFGGESGATGQRCAAKYELPLRFGLRVHGSLMIGFRFDEQDLAVAVTGGVQEIAEAVAQAVERIYGVAEGREGGDGEGGGGAWKE